MGELIIYLDYLFAANKRVSLQDDKAHLNELLVCSIQGINDP